ncbi:hypothetical protein [Streptomyces avicenniae]|uniref:hypothetical protein n=1 Tax=Streptomyces avicenniae TaxID=500153 RepID=UPI00069AEA62|nr:hypothetical protein [Streptomyces avicenniae]
MSRTGDGHGGTDGRTAGTVAARCLLVLVTLLCAFGLCTPAADAAGHSAAGQPPASTRAEPLDAYEDPADTCHGTPRAAVSPVLPGPVALHVPPQDPPPPAVRPVAEGRVTGPVHDATPAVDLHRLQVHRT